FCSCSFILPKNRFPQTEQGKGFSPVCIRSWRTSLFSTLGFFECVRLCLSSFDGLLKIFPQSGQGCLFVLLWLFWCRISFSSCVKLLRNRESESKRDKAHSKRDREGQRERICV
uniref:Uncharacterized protein n=1 Tax=Myripristis murdjan TaxID=586833 RepID=A0A668AX81_9TELE